MSTDVTKLVGYLAAGFPYAQVSKDTQRVYVQALKDIPLHVLTQAVEQCVAECEFFPTVAKVREKVTQIETPQWDTAADAWGDVMTAMRRVGFYGQPKFDNPITGRVVSGMDWQTLCSSENAVADRAHFMKMYAEMIEREKAETKLLPTTRALRAELTNERRQIQGTATDEQAKRVGADGVRPSGKGEV